MNQEEEIINKVANSGLENINLENFYPEGERVLIDLKHQLYEELILREKDFRNYIQNENWESYTGKFVAITCTADAVIPLWAYMLVANSLEPFAAKIHFGNLEQLEIELFKDAISKIDVNIYADKRVLVNGCSNKPVPASAFLDITLKLKPVVKSIMFGEACSAVPVFKKK